MPLSIADKTIRIAHRKFYNANNPKCIQVFSGGVRLLNPKGHNPAVLTASMQSKALQGLDENASAFTVSIFGKGQSSINGQSIDELCRSNRQWQLSFDNGVTKINYLVHGAILPNNSQTCWKFTLVKALR